HEPQTTGPRTLIVTMPRVSWSELRSTEMPNLHELMARGAVGLMPVASPSDADPHRTWVTLGAGRSAVGAADMGRAEKWGEVGVQADLAPLRRANEEANTGAQVGALGGLLQFHGLATAVIGDDQPAAGPLRCFGLLVLADDLGKVDYCRMGNSLRAGPGAGGELNPELVQSALREALLHYHIILLNLSSPERADSINPSSAPGDLSPAKAAALRTADAIIGDAVAALKGYSAQVIVISPISPQYLSPPERSLGPVVVYATDPETTPGLLTSSGTRWPGLVNAADFAPTVLARWGIHRVAPAGPDVWHIVAHRYRSISGHAMEAVPAANALSRLDYLDRSLSTRYQLRFAAGNWYLAYGGFVLAMALAFSLWWPHGLRRLGAAGLAVALAPIGLLVAPIAGLDRAAPHLLSAAAIAAAAALLAGRIRPPARALAAAMLLAAGLIVVDVVLGSPLMRRSTFGFGVMSGARFYGIGNEYMGFLAAMAVIGLGALLQAAPRARWLAALAGIAVVLAIGAPRAGANWGGAFAAAAGLVTLWLLRARKPLLKSLLVAVAVLAASALAPAALDLLRPAADRTHIGAGAAALLAGDGGMLEEAIRRKAAMNWGLLLSYRLPLLIGFLLFAVLLWRLLSRGGPVRQSLAAQPALAAGFIGAVVLALVAVLVNDSGVIAAAAAFGVTASATIFVAARPAEARA
ncbi:MAG: hypothetical protein JSV79_09300, partial [Armatimonadota bacterium]